MGKGSSVANEIFTPEQIKKLREFRGAVSKTLTPAEARNPSKTGYEVSRGIGDLIRMFGLSQVGTGVISGDLGSSIVGSGMMAGGRIRQGLQARQATTPVSQFVPGDALSSIGTPVGVGLGGLLSPQQEPFRIDVTTRNR
jgi:hypothetical protein